MFALIFIIIILALIVYYFRENKSQKGLENIPTISSLPITWAIIRKKPTDELRDVVIKASKGHDVYMSHFGLMKNVTISNPEYVRDLLMVHEDDAPKMHYSGTLSKFFGRGIPFSNGEKWRTYRKLTNPSFQSLSTGIVGETMFELFDLMKQNPDEPINMYEMMQRVTMEVLGKLVFGLPLGCLNEEIPHVIVVYRYIMGIVESVPRIVFPWLFNLPTETNRKFTAAVKEFDEFIYDVIETKRNDIENHKNNKNNDQVDLLTGILELSKERGVPFNAEELRDEMMGFIVAGETTSMAICTSLYFLAKYPEMQERARQEAIRVLGNEVVTPTSEQLKEMKYNNAIIKESLRRYPPVPAITPRKLTKPTKIGPHLIPADTMIKVNIWQIAHNPKFWENPKKYDPERFLNNEKVHPSSWIPFSMGPRNCIGQNFSLMEQRVILAMLLLKYKWTLPENSINKDKLIFEPHVLLRPLDLKLVFTERNKN